MNEFLIGVFSSIVATVIVSFFGGRKQNDSKSSHRWFWRLMLFIGKPIFFFGLFVLTTNLVLDPTNITHIEYGGLTTFAGLIFWIFGFILT